MNSWLRRWASPLVPRLRLLAFPPAGGAAHLFRSWAPYLSLDIELVAIELPGHGTRLAETPVTEMHHLIEGVMPELRALPVVPTAFLGHSMGAIVALAVCREWRSRDVGWRPEMLFVAGSEARRSRRVADDLATASGERLRCFLADAHATSAAGEVGAAALDPAVQDLVLPALRADLRLLNRFPVPDAPPLSCPVRVLAGVDDPFVDHGDRLDWAGESNGDFAVHLFPGGHFFYEEPDARVAVLARVNRELNTLAATRASLTA